MAKNKHNNQGGASPNSKKGKKKNKPNQETHPEVKQSDIESENEPIPSTPRQTPTKNKSSRCGFCFILFFSFGFLTLGSVGYFAYQGQLNEILISSNFYINNVLENSVILAEDSYHVLLDQYKSFQSLANSYFPSDSSENSNEDEIINEQVKNLDVNEYTANLNNEDEPVREQDQLVDEVHNQLTTEEEEAAASNQETDYEEYVLPDTEYLDSETTTFAPEVEEIYSSVDEEIPAVELTQYESDKLYQELDEQKSFDEQQENDENASTTRQEPELVTDELVLSSSNQEAEKEQETRSDVGEQESDEKNEESETTSEETKHSQSNEILNENEVKEEPVDEELTVAEAAEDNEESVAKEQLAEETAIKEESLIEEPLVEESVVVESAVAEETIEGESFRNELVAEDAEDEETVKEGPRAEEPIIEESSINEQTFVEEPTVGEPLKDENVFAFKIEQELNEQNLFNSQQEEDIAVQKSTLFEENSVLNELEEEETSTANHQSDTKELHHERDEVSTKPDENSNENS